MKLWLTCGAKNRRGLPCQCKELYENGRCRFHGGLSTGPKTPEGKARSLAAMRAGHAAWAASIRRADEVARTAVDMDQPGVHLAADPIAEREARHGFGGEGETAVPRRLPGIGQPPHRRAHARHR